MKKLFIAVSIAFIFFSCDNGDVETTDTEPNPFIGTWVGESSNVRYVFTETRVDAYSISKDTLQFSGTYTFTESTITITTDYRVSDLQDPNLYPNPFVWPYSIEGNVLTIAFGVVEKVIENK